MTLPVDRTSPRVAARLATAGNPTPWTAHSLLAAVAAILALSALAGWCFDLPMLTTLAPGRPALTPMTATGLLLGSAASVALPRRGVLASGLASLVMLGGVVIVAAHALKVPGIAEASTLWSSRLTGVMFIATGTASLLMAAQRYASGQVVSFALLLVAALMALAHLFPSADLYAYMPGTGVAAPTVIAFLALSSSQLLACRRSGLTGALTSRNTIGRTGRRLLLTGAGAILCLTLLTTAAFRQRWVDPESAILLIGWGAIVVLGVMLWSLVVAVDQAEAARALAEQERDQVRDMMVAALTHDLRNPLQAATMFTSLLQRLTTDSQSASTLERLQRNHRRLDRLLRSLLDSLALGSGRQLELHAVPVDLEQLVAEVVSDNATVLDGRVAWEGAARGWWDQDALFRLVENLILNAQKYSFPATPIWCHLSEPASGRVRLTVSNNGVPIPPDAWDTIFQPFTRGPGVGHGQARGWGVGLAFCRAVARRHGGDVRVSASSTDKTVFELDLPSDARNALQSRI